MGISVSTKFIKIIKGIYSKQKMRIKINGEYTNEILIQQGRRQGCPLSPLLFILTLEILNDMVRNDKRIEGIKIQEIYKLQAYADDLVFILENPTETEIFNERFKLI